MIPTPIRLKYIPILKFSSKVLLKKGKTNLASKMRRKADKIQDMINYLKTAS